MNLRPVDAELVAATESAVRRVRDLLDSIGVRGEVRPMGSSIHLGSLSKGDVDVLVLLPPAGFAQGVALLDELAARAQPKNWEAAFASFTLPVENLPGGIGEVGLQIVVADSALQRQLTAQARALEDHEVRRRYDVAKAHGSPLGPDGYWQVKDVFWSCLERPGPTWSNVVETPVCKVLTSPQWERLRTEGEIEGAPVDLADGFVHLSTPAQVTETIDRHFNGVEGLWLLTLDAARLAGPLRWEPSRGGALFPHLYARLRLDDVDLVRPWSPRSHHRGVH